MAAPNEVLISTDKSGQFWNACVWDPHSGTSLLTYKGNSTGARSLCLLSRDYLLAAVYNKPLLQLWPLQRKEQIQMKMVCPGKVSSLAVTSDGSYCVAGIEENIHIWQVSTGNLLAVISHHYQTVTCLRFTDDDSVFISAGEDNLVIAWSLQSVISRMSDPSQKHEAVHVWRAHSLPVTDICIGAGGNRARVVSSSLDHTCRLWDLSSGALLLTILFESAITSVTMDTPEYRLFAGSTCGQIFSVNLFAQPVRQERHISSTEPDESVTRFQGHSKQVICLAISLDGSCLYSGSHDCQLKLWDVLSGQCVRSIEHKGPVTNIISMLSPHSMFSHNHKPTLPVQSFKRHLYSASEAGGDNPDGMLSMATVDVKICGTDINTTLSTETRPADFTQSMKDEKECVDKEMNPAQRLLSLEEEVLKLRQTNRELYDFSLGIIQNKSKVT